MFLECNINDILSVIRIIYMKAFIYVLNRDVSIDIMRGIGILYSK